MSSWNYIYAITRECSCIENVDGILKRFTLVYISVDFIYIIFCYTEKKIFKTETFSRFIDYKIKCVHLRLFL